MLENCRSAQERWGGVDHLIDQWRKERQAVLVQFCRLTKASSSKVQRFCEMLVDYVSAGHFEIYDQLVKEAWAFNDQDGLQEATRLFAVIDQTTEVALNFNDQFGKTDDLSRFPEALSQLGESLVSRFEAEDRIITILHESHRMQAKTA